MADHGYPKHLIIKVFKSLKVVNLLDTQLVSSLSFRRKEEIISVFFVFFFFCFVSRLPRKACYSFVQKLIL